MESPIFISKYVLVIFVILPVICSSIVLENLSYEDRLAAVMLIASNRSNVVHQSKIDALGRTQEKVCYETLGCFTKAPIGAVPESPDKIQPSFALLVKVRMDYVNKLKCVITLKFLLIISLS